MTDFTKYKFVVEEKHGPFQKRAVYKYVESKECFILVSPNYMYIDRRKTKDEIETLIRSKKFTPYTKSDNVYRILNRMWENYSEDWTWEGERFCNEPGKSLKESPWHFEVPVSCKIAYHHGRLVWVSGFQYRPRVCYCPFEGFDKHPDWSHCDFTKEHNLSPVYNLSTNKYL